MDISARTDYAIRALLMLAEQAQNAQQAEQTQQTKQAQQTQQTQQTQTQGVQSTSLPVSVDTLASLQSLPRKFLEAILGDLRRAGIVVSQRGPRGGYRLSRPAAQITLGEVFRVVDGPLAEVRGLRPHETSYDGVAEHLPVVWVAVRASLRRVLDGTSLEQLLTGHLPAEVRALAQDPQAWQNR